MEPFSFGLIIVLVMLVGVVWAAISICVFVLRTIAWGLSLPGRAFRSDAVRVQHGQAMPAAFASASPQCRNEKCLTGLPQAARFCPRCGTGVHVARHADGRYLGTHARVA